MYVVTVSCGDGDVDETVETLGTYESWDEACEAAEGKFDAILDGLRGSDIYYGETEGSHQYDYYVTDGDRNVESGLVFSRPDYYCQVAVIER